MILQKKNHMIMQNLPIYLYEFQGQGTKVELYSIFISCVMELSCTLQGSQATPLAGLPQAPQQPRTSP